MKKLKILVVDDMPEVYQRIENSLNKVCKLGYANTLEGGLDEIRQNSYDGVITDFDLNGFDSIEIIKSSKDKGLPVIVMSKENVKEKVMKEGQINLYLRKIYLKNLKHVN